MDFSRATRGEGATKNVDLVAFVYDNAVAYDKKDPTKVKAHYVEFWGHPDSEIAQGQSHLALVTETREYQGKEQYNHSVAIAPKQMEALLEAAGSNSAPTVGQDGKRYGVALGVKGDLMPVTRGGKMVGYMPNTKTVQPSELSVADVDGKSIKTRQFDLMAETKAAREAEAKQAPEVQAEAQVEAPAVEAELEPELP